MVAIRRFIWPEYITIVLKLSLLTMAFSIRRACLGQLGSFLQQLGFCGPYWEKDNANSTKTYTTFNPINLVENGTRNTDYQGDFRCTNRPRQEAFQAAQLRGIKVDFIFPRKPLGSETTKCPSLARVLQMARNLVD
jgi:hypothetical protein